ncbi:MAG TPA: hypothetical protein VGB85_20795 [Nannocystis sp.]
MTTMHEPSPWDVIAGPAPAGEPSQLLRHALHFALTAPSPGNSQPWRFMLDELEVLVFTDPARSLPVRDPEGQQRIVAGGAAIGLLRVALRALGLGEQTTLLPGDHPDLLARITLTGSVAPIPEETWLMQAAPKRRTHRGPFADRPVRERLQARLQAMARDAGAELTLLHTRAQREAYAARVEAALELSESDPAAQAERAAWPEPGPEPFESPTGGPARGPEIAAGTPLLALITTETDDPRAWLIAGQALARVLLRGRVDHLQASYLQGPLARGEDRFAVAEQAAVLGDLTQTPGYAQLALRLGGGAEQPASSRRPLSEVLLDAVP